MTNGPDLPAGREVTIMSTTISAHPSRRLPLVASLTVVGVVAAAGAVGFAVHEATTSGTSDQSQSVTRPAGENAILAERGIQQDTQQFGKYQHYYSGQPLGGQEFQPPPGGKTVIAP